MRSPNYFILLTALILSACQVSEFGNSSTVVLYWSAPTERVNGDAMNSTEIGGYEIRYRKSSSSSTYTSITVSNDTNQYTIELPDGADYDVMVAAFDTDGIYSDFVTANTQ
jgi:hypothetical protein